MSTPVEANAAGTDPGADKGIDGVVPFTFHCHRCGHCCTAGSGYVWLEEGEPERLASRLSMDLEAFLARHVRQVPDPKTGELRLSLREQPQGALGIGDNGAGGGRCSLLEGTNHCTVYADRPEHCKTFPYWDSVLEDEQGFERARAVCPGIAVQVPEEVRARAFAALEELYRRVDAFVQEQNPVCEQSGLCCRFEEAGHELFATALETDYAADRHPEAPLPEAPGRCPHHVKGLCKAREGRPLGCRTYFCDPRTEDVLTEAHERFLAELRGIERETGYPVAYGRFPALLAARGVGV